MLHSEAPPVQLFIITRFSSLLKRKKEMKNMPPDFGPRRFSTDYVTSAMCKRSSAPFIERHCFHGMMSKEGATHMVLWWGFVLRNQRGGDGRLNKVSKGSGPYHCCPFPRRIPNSSCFCLTRSIYQAYTFGGWAQPWAFKIHFVPFTLGSGLPCPKYDPITLSPLPSPSTNFILCQALMRATIVAENM